MSGVVTLHQVPVFSGDIKLPNILLGPDGHLCIIDVGPTDGFTESYISPEQWEEGKLTEARDIFALGLVLWALSEEVSLFERADVRKFPRLPWHENKGSAPNWYRKMVESCLQKDPQTRPSAKHILECLLNEG